MKPTFVFVASGVLTAAAPATMRNSNHIEKWERDAISAGYHIVSAAEFPSMGCIVPSVGGYLVITAGACAMAFLDQATNTVNINVSVIT